MGIKLKVCVQCGEENSIGRTKSRCKRCRAKLDLNQPQLKSSNNTRILATYSDRDQILLSCGYPDYKTYLESNLWLSIRTRVLKRDNYKCRICDRAATEVHHVNYLEDTLLGKCFKGLISICHVCHHRLEFDEVTEQKLTLSDVIRKTNLYLALARKRMWQHFRGHNS